MPVGTTSSTGQGERGGKGITADVSKKVRYMGIAVHGYMGRGRVSRVRGRGRKS